jgi:hypothetical protein
MFNVAKKKFTFLLVFICKKTAFHKILIIIFFLNVLSK